MQNLVAPRDTEADQKTRLKVRDLCGDYLGGYWSEVKEDQLTIKRVTQGYVNEIYLVQLPENKQSIKEEYQKVIIKLFAQLLKSDERSMEQLACSYIMAGRNDLGPKILGLDPNGIISEYFESHNYCIDDDLNPEVVELLARKLARLHSMNWMPFHKTRGLQWTKNMTTKEKPKDQKVDFIKMIDDILKANPELEKTVNEDVYKNRKITDELQWVGKFIEALQSPVVFSHTDFNNGNILVSSETNNNKVDIKLVDFDFSGYHYRGYDIGRYFASWRQQDNLFGASRFPTDEEMEHFIAAYIDEKDKIEGGKYRKEKKNSVDVIRQEAKVFCLLAYLIDVWFLVWQSISFPDQRQDNLDKSKTRFNCYLQLKQLFIEQKSLPTVSEE